MLMYFFTFGLFKHIIFPNLPQPYSLEQLRLIME